MSRLEVQYAVRMPNPNGDPRGMVLPERYALHGQALHRADDVAAATGLPRGKLEVVAQVVMVAGDWIEPDRAERLVREHREHEQRYEQALISPLAMPDDWSREFEAEVTEVPWAPAKVLALREQGLSVPEISRRTGATPERVRVNLKRAMERDDRG